MSRGLAYLHEDIPSYKGEGPKPTIAHRYEFPRLQIGKLGLILETVDEEHQPNPQGLQE